MTDVDSHATVYARHELAVEAPPEVLWDLHTDVERWPLWHPHVVEAALSEPFAVGAAFTWRSALHYPRNETMTNHIEVVEKPRLVTWSGRARGARAFQSWRFEPTPNGTLIITEMALRGWFVWLFRKRKRESLPRSLESWAAALKTEAEARVGRSN